MGDNECELPIYNKTDAEAKMIMQKYKTIAVVGLSTNPEKPSYYVFKYLKENNYKVIPVNPNASGEILGEKVYASLKDIPDKVEIVQIFRPSKDVPFIIDEAISIGAKVIWMQEGIVNNFAADKAKKTNLEVVMNKCMLKIHKMNS